MSEKFKPFSLKRQVKKSDQRFTCRSQARAQMFAKTLPYLSQRQCTTVQDDIKLATNVRPRKNPKKG